MAVVVAESETAQQEAVATASDHHHHNDSASPPPPPAAPKLMDPKLLMAARRGDSERLKELLQLKKDEAHAHGLVEAAASAASSEVVIVDVVPQRRAPADSSSPPYSSSGSSAPPPPVDDGVTSEGDTLLHVVAACGDGEHFLRCAKMIVQDHYGHKQLGGAAAMRLALEAPNNKGDTPLHCAAGAGNANMISCLIDLIANNGGDDDEAAAAALKKKALVRMQNHRGETALHQAVRAVKNNVACIDNLMKYDPELACVEHNNGTSPLYLAISQGEMDIAQHLYSKSKGKLSYSGPDGRNVLHAAVSRGGLPMILKWLEDVKKTMTSRGGGVAAEQPDLLSQLTSQRDKQQKGSTPLHLAASLQGWPIMMRLPVARPSSVATTAVLLDANESTAYQADDEGSYPIHVAAWSGSLGVVKLLLERYPDCATLRDGKGRTFLHVAVVEKCLDVVLYVVCEEMPQQLSSMILNAQDNNGETALHGAVRVGNVDIFNCLFRNGQVRLDVANQDGMTPLALSSTMIPNEFHYGLNPRNIVHISLLAAGAPNGGGRPELFTEKHMPKRDLADEESKKYTEATQVASIVAALIATVTFASAFTFPGGYRSDNGEPVLAGSYAFDAFILADTFAFICSIAATCTLVYAGFPGVDINLRFRYLVVSTSLLQSAARSLVAAFGLGLYLVVHHTASAIAACAIVFASSLYGHMEVWPVILMATTVIARIGNRRRAVVVVVVIVLGLLLVHFWSYVIIFGLPAIRNWTHKKQL